MRKKVKVKIRRRNKYERLWRQIDQRFGPTPRSTGAEDAPASMTDDCFPGGRFAPVRLRDALRRAFDPIVYVSGFFYHFADCGVWRQMEEDELGRHAAPLLGDRAKPYYIKEGIKLLEYEVHRDMSAFEPSPDHINLANGMLEISTGALKPHSPEFNSRVQLPYRFDPNSTCPRWNRFLREVFGDDIGKTKTLQQWFGYCLTNETFLQKFMVFKGTGANGKTVALSVLSKLVGGDNICAIPLRKMEKDFLLITLRDKLVNLCGEIKTSRLIDSDIIKLLTGEDPITVDVKYRSAVTFRPTAKHIFSANEMPKFRDKTDALRRRIILLMFAQTFPEDKRDRQLTAKLLKELPGILRWALEGWKELSRTKEIYETASSSEYKARFAEALNPVLAFVNQACRLRKDARKIKRADLYREYVRWHMDALGDHPVSKPSFYERLRDDFPRIGEVRVHGEDYFKGIQVLRPRKQIVLRGKRGNRKT